MEINNMTGTTNSASSSQKSSNGQIMDKDGFLKLFLASLQYQDPMSPMETKDMMAQMTQLGTMEQMTNMSEIMEKMKEMVEQEASVMDGVSLLGKNVAGVNPQGELIEGKVDEVFVQDEILKLLIGGKMLNAGSISRVADYSVYQK